MRRYVRDLLASRRARAAIRRKAAVERAAREMKLDETQGGSIWRSGKGGGHHDRI